MAGGGIDALLGRDILREQDHLLPEDLKGNSVTKLLCPWHSRGLCGEGTGESSGLCLYLEYQEALSCLLNLETLNFIGHFTLLCLSFSPIKSRQQECS